MIEREEETYFKQASQMSSHCCTKHVDASRLHSFSWAYLCFVIRYRRVVEKNQVRVREKSEGGRLKENDEGEERERDINKRKSRGYVL